MTTLVSQNPNTSAEQTLKESVKCPQSGASNEVGDGLGCDEVVENEEDGGQEGNIAGDVVKTSSGRSFEAVSWNSVAELLDGEVGQHKLVAISIDERL